jgi:F-type H+-transporting ATPase subunit a
VVYVFYNINSELFFYFYITQMIFSPFEQFQIVELYTYSTNFILSNALFVLITIFSIYTIFAVLAMYTKKQTFNFFMVYFGELYLFFYANLKSYLGKKYFKIYFPFFFYVFLFIFVCNLTGLLPYSFTLTSHFAITFGLSSTIWFGILFIGLAKSGMSYFAHFYPKGFPTVLIFFLGVIELISNISRMFSLSIRLSANMIAGHILLDCLSFYVYNVLYTAFSGVSVSFISLLHIILPVVFFIGLLFFEACVCFLQAYIFVILSAIYLTEVI